MPDLFSHESEMVTAEGGTTTISYLNLSMSSDQVTKA